MAKLKNYNGRYCESEYESAFIAFLQSVGWTYLPGNKIKRCYRDVLIADDFRAFITKANGFIMSLTEYYVERRKAMEEFWLQATKVLNELKKIKYLDVDAPINTFCQKRKISKGILMFQYFKMFLMILMLH